MAAGHKGVVSIVAMLAQMPKESVKEKKTDDDDNDEDDIVFVNKPMHKSIPVMKNGIVSIVAMLANMELAHKSQSSDNEPKKMDDIMESPKAVKAAITYKSIKPEMAIIEEPIEEEGSSTNSADDSSNNKKGSSKSPTKGDDDDDNESLSEDSVYLRMTEHGTSRAMEEIFRRIPIALETIGSKTVNKQFFTGRARATNEEIFFRRDITTPALQGAISMSAKIAAAEVDVRARQTVCTKISKLGTSRGNDANDKKATEERLKLEILQRKFMKTQCWSLISFQLIQV